MDAYAVSIRFNNAPLLFVGGIIAVPIALAVIVRITEAIRERRKDAQERGTFRDVGGASPASFGAVERMEAMKLMERIGAIRARMLELDRALTQRREGVRWRVGISGNADKDFRDAAIDSELDRFLSDATERDLNAAQGEMVSLFRDAANWLKKYAPEEVPPPPVRVRLINAVRTFLGKFFPALRPDDACKQIPVVEKTEKKRLPGGSEPPEKVADGETPESADAPDGGNRKGREKLRIPLDLLDAGKPGNAPDAAKFRAEARHLADAMRTYKIDAEPVGTPVRGPSVTRYEFRLQPGVKLSKLTGAADDIALSLGVPGVRIAPVPDKASVIGIEAPNAERSLVSLRGVLESREFAYSPPTAFALGRGIDGGIVTGDLEKLPHVLIAGTTGSGKSVCMNALIVSLLYKSAPDELRFIMIDPKRVELAPYAGIPHLKRPVVTDAAQAVSALSGAVVEMETRYRAFEGRGAKELADYNRGAKSPFPRLVIVIDELADLMMASGKDVEASVVRLAQMGRAAGIHLVIATQRPSADVITGLMKANIPSRIAFAVASALESRIILDANGAEKLTGGGDMIYAPLGGEKRRLQGAYIAAEEISRVTDFLREAAP